mmetsp:Transcript_16846/g.25295  ORF Transcript_16846/g.25295 Transcript_16846/m.25295 type:complete len:235 (+) Transcript_16846:82-786(+)
MAKPDKASSSSQKRKESTDSNTYQDKHQSLQERLHTLLSRLSDCGECLKTWPETKTGDDASIHIRQTDKLIASVQRIIQGIKQVEEKVNSVPAEGTPSDEDIYLKLRQIAIPLDLLDMTDFAGGLNPDCYARGLIKESLRQMGNLQRRKTSMKMLAVTIQNGIDAREKQLEILKSLDEKLAASNDTDDNKNNDTKQKEEESKESSPMENDVSSDEKKKRKRDEEGASDEPPSKR